MSMWGGCWDIGGKLRNKMSLTFTFCSVLYFFIIVCRFNCQPIHDDDIKHQGCTYLALCAVIKQWLVDSPHHMLRPRTKSFIFSFYYYNDVIMSTTTYQITRVSVVYSIICLCADQRKHQSSASLAFVRGIHRWPVNSSHKGPVTRKMVPFDDVIMLGSACTCSPIAVSNRLQVLPCSASAGTQRWLLMFPWIRNVEMPNLVLQTSDVIPVKNTKMKVDKCADRDGVQLEMIIVWI